ncbi:hypothetical protein HBI56_135630 [Parastagonospora nodorum]|nr:hypothetical protein HBI13_020640 [Parastagonospora nodorum]KAH4075510.1 hypothetical protein HBH50_017740 [Parastagonospora nodorum]KAH4098185.1 hypothetical protein HBH48_029560 [Parastagonospora nodorum]KAH4108318.1 hypothetical protein HBH46_040400 [Parastagonospora nodorum]KAH4255707.1 hypothetical protein HBI03_171060 [Parastagonospora nodorum]
MLTAINAARNIGAAVLGGLASQWTEVKHHVLLFTFHATRFLTNAEGCTRGRTLQDRARPGPGAAVLEQGCADCEVSMLARVGLLTWSYCCEHNGSKKVQIRHSVSIGRKETPLTSKTCPLLALMPRGVFNSS